MTLKEMLQMAYAAGDDPIEDGFEAWLAKQPRLRHDWYFDTFARDTSVGRLCRTCRMREGHLIAEEQQVCIGTRLPYDKGHGDGFKAGEAHTKKALRARLGL